MMGRKTLLYQLLWRPKWLYGREGVTEGDELPQTDKGAVKQNQKKNQAKPKD
jgi:hypothetical protein